MRTTALHIGHQRHQPWCQIFHNPAMTSECWCDAQIAATAYKLGLAEGLAMAATQRRFAEPEPDEDDADLDVISVNALPV